MTRSLTFFIALLLFTGCIKQPDEMAQMAKYAIKTRSTPVKPATSKETKKTTASAPTRSATDAPGAAASTSGTPIAVLENNVFDFGTMEPYQSRKHAFTVRNDGDAPLEIRAGHSSCKCTIGEVGDGIVPPGGQSTVTLTWKSSDTKQVFAHEAEVLTNDPNNPVLTCRVTGKIRTTLTLEPAELAWPSIYPGEADETFTIISSQIWDQFEILDIKSTMEGLTWNIEPLDNAAKEQIGAKSGYRLTAVVPTDLPRGYFSHTLQFQVQRTGETSRLIEVPVSGKVLRRVSLYGKGIDSSGTVKLGKIKRGRALRHYFTVKVRDPEPHIKVASVETYPDFVQVSFIENDRVKKPGLYRMLVEIPATAPVCNHMGHEPAQLHVQFDHPRLEDMQLKVEFAVVGSDDF